MTELAPPPAPGQLPGGIEADEDMFASVGAKLQNRSRNASPSRGRGFEDWSQLNPSGQTGIVVRNTFIDVCPLEEESDGGTDACASPHRRNLSAPPSPTRNRNPWANEEGAQYVDSDQEEEEDPGSIPNYQWAPDSALLKAEDSSRSSWIQGPPGSPKKVPGKPKKLSGEVNGRPGLGDILKGGISLAGMHGITPPADPYAALGLAPATGGEAGGRNAELAAGLGSIFGQGGGLGGLGTASSVGAGGMDPRGLSTLPPPNSLPPGVPPGYHLAEGFGSTPALGVPGPSVLGSFDAVGLGSIASSLPTGSMPPVDPLLGFSSPGLGAYGGFAHLNQELPAPPPGPPLGLSSQVLSSERLATAPPPSSVAPASPPPPEAAYISDNPPPRTPLAGHIPTEAPAYVLGTSAPVLSSSPPEANSNQVTPGASRRSSMSKGEGKGVNDLKGMFGGMGVDPFGSPAMPPEVYPGLPPGYPRPGLGAVGDAAARFTAESTAAFMDASDATIAAAYAMSAEQPGAGGGHWNAGGNRGSPGPWIAGGALRGMEVGDMGGGAGGGRPGRGKGQGRGSKNQAPVEAGGAGGGGGGGEAKGRVPLSGGGPKRTDYIKKYGGGGGQETDNTGNNPVPITTMMLKNIPCRKSQEEVMMHIDQKGFGNRYDFFYLPRDVKFRANLGYAFINFLTPEDASNFSAEMNGYRFSSSGSMKACAVVPAHVQGLMNNLAAFKRTEVMRSSRRPYFSNSMTNV